jgi:hypothetical protein
MVEAYQRSTGYHFWYHGIHIQQRTNTTDKQEARQKEKTTRQSYSWNSEAPNQKRTQNSAISPSSIWSTAKRIDRATASSFITSIER